jgi:5-methylcytosine-specific restriction endonuclease McrA
MGLNEKLCRGCDTTKPLSLFYKNGTRKDGHDTWCKQCSNNYSKEHYHINAPKRRLQMNLSRKKRSREDAEIAFSRVLSRIGGRIEATVFQLVGLYHQSPYCCFCGIHLSPDKVSFDHKTPLVRGGPRTIENIAVSCADCNFLKGQRTAAEFEVFVLEYCDRFKGRTPADDRGEGSFAAQTANTALND